MRLSKPMPLATSSTLPPESSQIRLTALINEILRAKKELLAYLINSADSRSVMTVVAFSVEYNSTSFCAAA